MNNLRKFTTEAEYTAATLNYPAVSWVTVTDTVHFDKDAPVPPTPTFSGLTVYYDITDTSQPKLLFNGGGGSGSGSGSGSGGVLPSAMIIDGTAVEVTEAYQFSTTGEHIVNYSFEDNAIPKKFLYGMDEKFHHLVGVEIGDAITSIGNEAFNSCTSLTSCTIGSGLTSIGEYAFAYCTSLTSINIPDSVTSIGYSAFRYCSRLTNINIPSGVTSIKEGTFGDCTSLTNCTIGSGVAYIGDSAFWGCNGLTSINIPDSVTKIGNEAFNDCSGLSNVIVEATTPPTMFGNAFDGTSNCPIYVPSASLETYKAAGGWSNYANRIQAIA